MDIRNYIHCMFLKSVIANIRRTHYNRLGCPFISLLHLWYPPNTKFPLIDSKWQTHYIPFFFCVHVLYIIERSTAYVYACVLGIRPLFCFLILIISWPWHDKQVWICIWIERTYAGIWSGMDFPVSVCRQLSLSAIDRSSCICTFWSISSTRFYWIHEH